MKYAHRFQVAAPLAVVADFHRQSASMAAITPPPISVEIHRAPVQLAAGDEMEFTLWIGPFPIRWLARIEHQSPTSFMDRQLRGPFARWVHRHTFAPLKDGRTEVLDEVEVTLARQWFWRLFGFGMWSSLPLLFAYRAWKTRRLLASKTGVAITPARG